LPSQHGNLGVERFPKALGRSLITVDMGNLQQKNG
jgi:hypothetical protein